MVGLRVGIAFAGPADGRVRSLVEQSLGDAGGGSPVRVRALKLPIDLPSLRHALAKRPALAALATKVRVDELGRRLGQEFVDGGETPLWTLLSPQLVEEQAGNDNSPLDGVVLARTVPAQSGVTARFLAGFYSGLASAGLPAVGVERMQVPDSAIEAFGRADLSTVDDVDSESGRLALVLLLGGATPGSYGVKKTADDGLLPPIPITSG